MSNSTNRWIGRAGTVPGVVNLGAYGRARMFGSEAEDKKIARQRELRNALIAQDELIKNCIKQVQKLKKKCKMKLSETDGENNMTGKASEIPMTKGEAKAKEQAQNLAKRAAAAQKRVEALHAKSIARAKKDAARTVKQASNSRKRNAPFVEGKRLFALTNTNHHKSGSKAWSGLQIILTYPGISYEDYIAHGGKLQDLALEIVRGCVDVVNPKADAVVDAA